MTPGTDAGHSSDSIEHSENWSVILRDLCEAHEGCLPHDFSSLTLDELYILCWDRKRLILATGGRISGTSSELAALNLLPTNYRRGKSVARILIEHEERKTRIAQLESAMENVTGKHRREMARQIRRLKREDKAITKREMES